MSALMPVESIGASALTAALPRTQAMAATVQASPSLEMQDEVGPIAPAATFDALTGASSIGATSVGGSFGRMVSNGLQQVNGQLISSQVDLQRLAVGDASNLHQIMINLEESRLSFQLMMQVRNRVLEAYQDIMKMPV